MRQKLWTALGVLVVLTLVISSCTPAATPTAEPTKAAPPPTTAPAAAKVTLLLSMKGPGGGNPFWAEVEKGAKETAAANKVDIVVLAPPAETDVATQISQIEDQITKKVSAILVAPTDVVGLNPTFDKAKAAKIPILFVDTKGNWADALTFIGTNNRNGGKLAGEFICQQLGGKGKVALITGVMSQQTHIDRIGGAEDALKACGLTVVAKQAADSDQAKGQTVMENVLTANPDVNAVFASNDLMALGAMEAIKAAGKKGIVVVGFDANPDAVKSIEAGEMAASIAQSPYNMGKYGVEAALKAIKGEKIDAVIDTGTKVVTKGGAAAPAAKVTLLLSMKGPGGGNPFWAEVEKGAKETAAANKVDIVVLAPPAETDVATQISQIEDQITKKVSAILVAPTDVVGLNPTFDKAKAAKIPVLFVDTKGNWADALTFIGTNNRNGGKLAGEFICDKLKGKGKVALITGVMSQQTHIDRIGGAEDALKACGLTVVAKQAADSDRAKGQTVMENVLTANPDVAAVFASNDLMALGAMEAIKSAGKKGIVVVGFDANPDAVKSIEAGEMAASIAQSPYNMGKYGVEAALKAIKGEKIDAVIDTGTKVVTKGGGSVKADKPYKLLLSMKGPGGGNPFWAAVEKGAKETATAVGVELTVLAPPAETDVATQISQIEDQITKKVNAIIVAPTDVVGLNPTFDKAKVAKIPVLFVDTKGNWADALTFIGTNNRNGGKLAGEYICKKLNGKGKVALITGVMSQQTHIDRIGGAEDAMKACGLTVVAKQAADSDRAKGQTVMENVLTANPDVAAVFASNDLMALGAMEAIKSAGKKGIVVVGFDANPDAAASILKGEMSASIAQSPYNMGKYGVEYAVRVLMGEKIDTNIDTGTELVTADNADKYK
jgi:ribose transport system substrate-binding protein